MKGQIENDYDMEAMKQWDIQTKLCFDSNNLHRMRVNFEPLTVKRKQQYRDTGLVHKVHEGNSLFKFRKQSIF